MRDDLTLQTRATFHGFEVLSRGKGSLRFSDSAEDERTPEIFLRGGATTYTAKLNPENPFGTVQSIEHSLRSLERHAENYCDQIERLEKTLADYRAQANKPYEHEDRLREPLVRQAQLNAALDLDKGERQIAEAAAADNERSGETLTPSVAFAARLQQNSSAAFSR